MHTASYEFLIKPKESAGCHQTLSARVGSGDETTALDLASNPGFTFRISSRSFGEKSEVKPGRIWHVIQWHRDVTHTYTILLVRRDVTVPPYHVPNPSRLYLRFFSKATRQNPERKAWVRGYTRPLFPLFGEGSGHETSEIVASSLVPRLPRSGTRTLKLCRRGEPGIFVT